MTHSPATPLIDTTTRHRIYSLPLGLIALWVIFTIACTLWTGVPYGPHSEFMDAYGDKVLSVFGALNN